MSGVPFLALILLLVFLGDGKQSLVEAVAGIGIVVLWLGLGGKSKPIIGWHRLIEFLWV